jgi:hypothetical protein
MRDDANQIAGAGSILFAGEHLSDAFPGYMNGAAQTGRLAAQRSPASGRCATPLEPGARIPSPRHVW